MVHYHSQNHVSGNYKLVIFIFLIVYHFVLFYSLNQEPVNIRDSQEYINSSISFKNNENFYAGASGSNTDYRLFSKRTPFYPFVLYLFNKLNIHLNLLFILQIFIALFNIYITIKLLRFLSNYHSKPLYLFAFFVLFTPAQFIYSVVIMADIWLQLFITVCFWFYVEFIKSKHSFWLVFLIIASTLGALTKPVFLLFSLAIGVCTFYYFIIKSQHKILILISILPVLSWYIISSQNQKNTGVFHYSSISYINILHYNTNLFLNKTIGKTETEKLLSPLMTVPANIDDFKNNYSEVNKVCIEQILKYPFSYTVFHLKGMLYFFIDPGRYDVYNFLRLEKTNSDGFLHNGFKVSKIKSIIEQQPLIFLFLVFVLIVNVTKTIGFLGFLWLKRTNLIVLGGAALVFYIAFLTGPLGASRFALPVNLIISCFAAIFYYIKFRRRLIVQTEKE